MRLFVSYTTSDGGGYARRAKDVLSPSHDAWVWVLDNAHGAYTWNEIAREIEARDIFLCILTRDSATSRPQREEVALAMNSGKRILALVTEDGEVYPELRGRNYRRFTNDTFDEICEEISISCSREVTIGAQLTTARSDRRRDQIQQLRRRTGELDPRVLELAEREAQTSYLAMTLPPQILRFAEAEPDGTFVVHAIEESGELAKFNDPSCVWDLYFSECGRAVALAERKYLTDTILNAHGVPAVEAQHMERRFVVLNELVRELAAAGVPARTLLAPIEDLPAFARHHGDRLGWSAGSHMLETSNGRVRVIWSSNAAPLHDYVLLSPQAGLWRVVPDPDTGQALTVAVGALRLYGDSFQVVVQTLTKCEVTEPGRVRIMTTPLA